MALSDTSCLFYWDAAFGMRPLRPSVADPSFSRSGKGWVQDRTGRWNRYDDDVARWRWQKRAYLSLDPAQTNLARENVDFASNGAANWTSGGDVGHAIALTTPSGRGEWIERAGLSKLVTDGELLRIDNTGGTAKGWAVAPGGGSASTNNHSFLVYARGSGQMTLNTSSTYASASQHTLSDEILPYTELKLAPGAAAEALRITVEAGDWAEVVLYTVVEKDWVANPVRNPNSGSDASSVTEEFYWQSVPLDPSAEIAWYVRFRVRGTIPIAAGLERLVQLGYSTGGRAHTRHGNSAADQYFAFISNGTNTVAASITFAASSIVEGTVVELLAVMQTDDRLRLYGRINDDDTTFQTGGSAIITGGWPTTWGNKRIYLNSETTNNKGSADYAQVKIFKTADFAGTGSTIEILKEASHFLMTQGGQSYPLYTPI